MENVIAVVENVPGIAPLVPKKKLTAEEIIARDEERRKKACESAKKYYLKKKTDPAYKEMLNNRAKEYQRKPDVKARLKVYRREYYKKYRQAGKDKVKELQDQLDAIKKLVQN